MEIKCISCKPLLCGLSILMILLAHPLISQQLKRTNPIKITGKIFSSRSLDPIENAKVVVYDKNGLEIGIANSDENGHYELKTKRKSVFSIIASKANHVGDTIYVNQNFSNTDKEIKRNFYLGEILPLVLQVRVYSKMTRMPVENARIEIIPSEGVMEVYYSNAHGEAEFEVQKGMVYQIKVSRAQFMSNSRQMVAYEPDDEGIIYENIYLERRMLATFTPVPEFPWPPPAPSTKIEIPSAVFEDCTTLGEVNELLVKALVNNDYNDRSYFLTPAILGNGFALATQLEQIDKNARSKSPPNRWNVNPLDNSFRFSELISSLFFSNPGYFRVIVFIVTDMGFIPSKTTVSRDIAISWLDAGFSSFPPTLVDTSFSNNHKVTALIYEYELLENSENASLLKPSRHSGKKHLENAKIWMDLNNN